MRYRCPSIRCIRCKARNREFSVGVRPVGKSLFSISDSVRLRLLVIKCHCYKFVNAIFLSAGLGLGPVAPKSLDPGRETWAVAVNLRMKSAFLLCQGRYGSARGIRLWRRLGSGEREERRRRRDAEVVSRIDIYI